jgi:hypothetical protein
LYLITKKKQMIFDSLVLPECKRPVYWSCRRGYQIKDTIDKSHEFMDLRQQDLPQDLVW